ncbi:MAG: hypothetical protein ACK4YO_01385 [Candidatus Altarchaeaceae archaeon]
MILPDALIGALKYIKKFRGKIFVIAIGWNGVSLEDKISKIAREIALLNHVGINPVVVHETNLKDIEKFKEDSEFLKNFLEKENEIGKYGIIGKINLKIVSCISREDVSAFSLIGELKNLNINAIKNLINFSIPVISPLDDFLDFASKISVLLKAEKLIIMDDEEGILDLDEELIPEININRLKEIKNDVIYSKIDKILEISEYALNNNVDRIHIIKASENKLIEEIFTDEGVGTIIFK